MCSGFHQPVGLTGKHHRFGIRCLSRDLNMEKWMKITSDLGCVVLRRVNRNGPEKSNKNPTFFNIDVASTGCWVDVKVQHRRHERTLEMREFCLSTSTLTSTFSRLSRSRKINGCLSHAMRGSQRLVKQGLVTQSLLFGGWHNKQRQNGKYCHQ